jgi:hypothetical protein
MNLAEQLREYIAAAFSGIWIRTWEPEEAHREIVAFGLERGWRFLTWDAAQGAWGNGSGSGDPTFPLKPPADGAAEASDITRLVLLLNYHRFLNNPPAGPGTGQRRPPGQGVSQLLSHPGAPGPTPTRTGETLRGHRP